MSFDSLLDVLGCLAVCINHISYRLRLSVNSKSLMGRVATCCVSWRKYIHKTMRKCSFSYIIICFSLLSFNMKVKYNYNIHLITLIPWFLLYDHVFETVSSEIHQSGQDWQTTLDQQQTSWTLKRIMTTLFQQPRNITISWIFQYRFNTHSPALCFSLNKQKKAVAQRKTAVTTSWK